MERLNVFNIFGLYLSTIVIMLPQCILSSSEFYFKAVGQTGYKVHGTDVIATMNVQREDPQDAFADCILYCLTKNVCASVNFNSETSTCELLEIVVIDPNWLTISHGYKYFHRENNDISLREVGCFLGENHQQYTTLITDDYRAEFLSWSSYNDSCVQAVYGCSVMAKLQNYPVFGIEFAGECYGSLGLDYFVDSESTTCVHGVGLYGFEVYWYEIL